MKTRNKKGFTIVELVIVIAVIGILTAILVPVFINLTNKANRASDDSLVKNLNTAMSMEEGEGKTNNTYNDAIQYLDNYGFKLENLATKSEYSLLWNSKTNRFLLNEESAFNKDQTETGAADHQYWTIQDSIPDTPKYSVYAGLGWDDTAAVELNGIGFDAGNHNPASVTYNNSESVKNVTLRTNSATTSLTINDTTESTIKHYGVAGALSIIQCHTESYHENGKIAFAEIAKGHIVLENNSEIKHIHIDANADANGFEEVKITDNGAKALPEAITRDQVDVSEAKAVVTVVSGSTSETVYVYPYTDSKSTKTGTTEQTTTQNTAIATDLGKLVLDNGSDAGEKAMSNNEKASVKQEVVEVAQNEEAVEKAEEAGYVVTHHEELAPTCTENGHTAYDSYEVNGEEVKIGYKDIPALGHQKAENPSYQHAFSAAHWQHATQCVVDSAWIVEDCVDENNDNHCDICNQQMYVLIYTISDLHTNSKYPTAIWNGAYKLMNNVSLDTMSRIYGDVVIDLNGYTLSNYSINSPADTQFMSYSNANAIYTLTLRDSSISKTGMFMSRFGDTFFDGSGNSGNNRFILNCEDGVKIDTTYDYSGNELQPSFSCNTPFINNASKNIEIINATIICGNVAYVNSGYTVTFKNCTIQTKSSSDFNLVSGSGSIVFDGCTITTYGGKSNALDSSSYPTVTFTNGTTVNGVAK